MSVYTRTHRGENIRLRSAAGPAEKRAIKLPSGLTRIPKKAFYSFYTFWRVEPASKKPKRSHVAGLPVLVHLRRDFLACDKALRAQIAEPFVRSFHVVMLSPILNDDAGFA